MTSPEAAEALAGTSPFVWVFLILVTLGSLLFMIVYGTYGVTAGPRIAPFDPPQAPLLGRQQ